MSVEEEDRARLTDEPAQDAHRGRARPRLPRRWVALVGACTLVLVLALGGALAVRADRAATARAQAHEAELARSAAAAAQAQAARELGAATASREGQARAAELAAAVLAATARRDGARAVLDSSLGKVTDDAVRVALADALNALDALLTATSPARASAAQVRAAADAVDAASTAVTDAQAAWEKAEVERPSPAPTLGSGAAKAGSAGSGAAAGVGADGRPVDAAGNILWVTSVPTADGDGSNGHMPMSAMCAISWGTDQLGYTQYLRCDAAGALTDLEAAFRAHFGESIAMDLTYRSYADQVAMKAAFGPLAAAPGTSSHGYGTALDVQEWPDVYGFGTPRYEWLVANGPAFGWSAPARVREGAAYPEYWHFEYAP